MEDLWPIERVRLILPELKDKYLQGVPTQQLASEMGLSMNRLHLAFRRWLPLTESERILHMEGIRRRSKNKSVLKHTTEASEE